MLETPPKWQSWTFMEVCFAAFSIVAACLVAYAAAQFGLAPWVAFAAFGVTLVLMLVGIVRSQSKRREVYEENYAAWLEHRVGGPPKRKVRPS